MIRYHIALFLTLSMVMMQAADSQKIKFIYSLAHGDNVECKAPEIVDEIDFTKKETNTKETFGSLYKRAHDRGTPWPIVATLALIKKGYIIDYFDLVELVRTYGTYTKNDFRSFDNAERIIGEAVTKILEECDFKGAVAATSRVFYANKPTFNKVLRINYNVVCADSSYNIKVHDIHAILAAALCKDYVPALAVQRGLIYDKTASWLNEKKVWNNFIDQLPKDTFEKTCQQFKEVYLD